MFARNRRKVPTLSTAPTDGSFAPGLGYDFGGPGPFETEVWQRRLRLNFLASAQPGVKYSLRGGYALGDPSSRGMIWLGEPAGVAASLQNDASTIADLQVSQ